MSQRERKRESERESESEKRKGKEREKEKTKVRAIIFLNRLGQIKNPRTKQYYTGKSGIVCSYQSLEIGNYILSC
jgi:hypothetical protein